MTTINIHFSSICQRTKYLDVRDDFSLALSCPYICIYIYVCVWLPSSTSLEKKEKEREMEKRNVSDQMVEYEFIWYIPFEDWSFDDIVYTHVGSIVTVSFSLYVFKHYIYIYMMIDWREKKKKRRSFYEAYHHIFWWLSLSLLLCFVTHTDHLCMNDKSTSSSIGHKDASCSSRQ